MFIRSFGHSPAISSLLTVPPYLFASTYTRHLIHGYPLPFLLPISNSSFRLGLAVRQVQDPLAIHLLWPHYDAHRILDKYFGRGLRSEILRDFLRCCGCICFIPRRRGLVRHDSSILCALSTCIILRLGNNLAGQYKRGVGMAVHIGIGNFSGAIASNIYRTQDSPRFIIGRESIVSLSDLLFKCSQTDVSSCLSASDSYVFPLRSFLTFESTQRETWQLSRRSRTGKRRNIVRWS
jgi:hypothetical protein